jgi:hypothetical protein
MPLEDVEPNHARVALEALFLVVEKRANRTHVQYRYGLEILREDPREQGKDRRLSLATGGGREDHRVAAVEDGVDRQLLDRSKRTPPKVVDDGVLHVGVETKQRHWLSVEPTSALRFVLVIFRSRGDLASLLRGELLDRESLAVER